MFKIKKILTLAFNVIIALSMSMPVFSVDINSVTIDNNLESSAEIPANIIFGNGCNVPVIVVDIVWENMAFGYTAPYWAWDFSEQKFKKEGPFWSDNKPTITIINRSNVAINATATFEKNSNISESFNLSFITSISENETENTLTLDSAAKDENRNDITAIGSSGTAQTGCFTVKVADPSAEVDFGENSEIELGKINVKITTSAGSN